MIKKQCARTLDSRSCNSFIVAISRHKSGVNADTWSVLNLLGYPVHTVQHVL